MKENSDETITAIIEDQNYFLFPRETLNFML